MKIKNKEFYQIKVTDKFIEGDVYLILDANKFNWSEFQDSMRKDNYSFSLSDIKYKKEDILNTIYKKHSHRLIIDMDLMIEIYNEFLSRYGIPSCSADELNTPFSENDKEYDKYTDEVKNNLDDVNLFVSNYIDLWESQGY